MSKEKINEKLDSLLANPKSRNFLNHLVRSYFPEGKVEKVFISPKKNFNCVITNDRLISVNEIIDGTQTEQFKEDFFKHLHGMLEPNSNVETPMAKLVGEKKLALQGTKTDTFMSVPAYYAFSEWIVSKVLLGNKHISWLLKKIKKDSLIKRAEFFDNPEVQKVVKKHTKTNEVRATYTLGDLPQLHALKEKFNKN